MDEGSHVVPRVKVDRVKVDRVKVDRVFPALPRCLDIYPSLDLLPLLVLELQHYYTSSNDIRHRYTQPASVNRVNLACQLRSNRLLLPCLSICFRDINDNEDNNHNEGDYDEYRNDCNNHIQDEHCQLDKSFRGR